MMKLNIENENVRDLAIGLLTREQAELGILTEDDLTQVGREWVTNALSEVDFNMVYTQSVGAFEILQWGTIAEREAWDAALEKYRPGAEKYLAGLIAERLAEPRDADAE